MAKSAKEHTQTLDELKAAKDSSGITLDTLIDDYLSHLSDPSNPNRPNDLINPKQRLNAIRKAFGDRPAGSIKAFEIEDWLLSLKREAGTLNRYKSTFSAIYRYARGRGKIEVNPVRDAKQFKTTLPIPRWLREDEEVRLRAVLQRWIDECPAHRYKKGLELRCHPHELTIALQTGMRKGNQYGLRWDEVDFDHRRINLTTTKTGKPQSIPMNSNVYVALQDLKVIQAEIESLQDAARKKDGKPQVRMVADGRVFNISENREWWKMALVEAKIKNFRWHDLRHSFASKLMKQTGNIRIVQEAGGWATVSMASRYSHVAHTDLSAAMEGLARPSQSPR